MNRASTANAVVLLVAVGFLLLALPRQSYGYYTLLRWVVCSAAAYHAASVYSRRKVPTVWLFAALALLFNPFAPVHLDRQLWKLVDLVAAVVFGVNAFVEFRESAAMKRHEASKE